MHVCAVSIALRLLFTVLVCAVSVALGLLFTARVWMVCVVYVALFVCGVHSSFGSYYPLLHGMTRGVRGACVSAVSLVLGLLFSTCVPRFVWCVWCLRVRHPWFVSGPSLMALLFISLVPFAFSFFSSRCFCVVSLALLWFVACLHHVLPSPYLFGTLATHVTLFLFVLALVVRLLAVSGVFFCADLANFFWGGGF